MVTRSFQTKSGQLVTFHEITISEAKRLIHEKEGQLLHEYSNHHCESYFYLLNDSTVVHIPLGLAASVYEPYDAFVAHMNESNISKKISQVSKQPQREFGDPYDNGCFCPNPFGEDFPNFVDELAAKLPEILEAPDSMFDFTFGNLLEIDWHLYKHIITPDFRINAFLPLLAYIGKSYIQQKGGNWEMLYDEKCQNWLPDVRQVDGELKMLYYPISIILNPYEGKGTYYALRMAFNHVASNPQD